jgi:glycosyltransferase involved in cell wall biosynthesis
VNITPLKQLSISLAALCSLIRWAWSVRRRRHRVICAYNLTIPSGWFAWLAARLTGSKFIACLNDINVPGQTVPATVYTRLDFWLQRALIPRLDGHIAVADRIMRDFAPGKPYLRMEGGITAEVLDRVPSHQRKESDHFTIVSVGLLNEANGIHLLLEAFARLSGDRFRLRIAGEGPLAQAVRDAAARDPRIEYCGFLSFPQVLALYCTADALINMRLTQKINTLYFFPSKMMEYLASGVPVITTAPAHVAEEFQDLAYLLKEETSDALLRCIHQLAAMDPAERRARGARARQYMAANKTWDAQGRKFTNHVLQIVLSGTQDDA